MKLFSPVKLKKLLDERCIRYSTLARRAGISTSAMSSLINGQKVPNVNTIARIAYVLKKPVDFFLEDTEILDNEQLLLPSIEESRKVSNE